MCVRPWNALSKTSTAGRPVAERAIFTAFSSASAPLFTRTDFWLVPRHGETSASRRHTSTYGSYMPTTKHWWRYSSACAWIAATTASGRCPRLFEAMPPAKSMYSRPSTSQTRAPSARATTRCGVATPFATYRSRSARTRSVAFRSCKDTVKRLYIRHSVHESGNEPQIVDEPRKQLVAILAAQHGAGVDRRRDQVGEVGVERLAAVPGEPEVLAQTGLCGRRAEQHERPRLDHRQLRLEPWPARDLLCPGRRVVDPARAARLPLEVLDRVRDVRLLPVDARFGERLVEQPAGRPDERRARLVLLVARLLADEHHLGTQQPLAEDG